MLVTGSLGSGKTTLLGRILEGAHQRIAVLMNEFGEIAIDSKVIAGEHVLIVELAGGCVCCELTGEFEAAVGEILGKARPDYIVVEATGVAEADALVYEVEDNLPEVRLDSVVCIVDAYMGTRHPEVGHTARTHLAAADIVLVNKIDLVSPAELEKVEAEIRKYNGRALLLRTERCGVNTGALFGVGAGERDIPRGEPAATALESFSFRTEGLLDRARFERFVSDLGPNVYRAKGFVLFPDGSFLFNYVVGRSDMEDFPAKATELVFIGKDIVKEKEGILSRLSDCVV